MICVLSGSARLAPYLAASGGNRERSCGPYTWAVDLAGALHSTICFVEVGVRNAIDHQLKIWNAQQGAGYGSDWALTKGSAPLLYEMFTRKSLRSAQEAAHKEARQGPLNHPRYDAQVTHDDVVAQLMFGTWVHLQQPRHRASPGRDAARHGEGVRGCARALRCSTSARRHHGPNGSPHSWRTLTRLSPHPQCVAARSFVHGFARMITQAGRRARTPDLSSSGWPTTCSSRMS